jgi:hypothetical protein
MSSWNQIFDEAFDNYVKCAPLMIPKTKKSKNDKQTEKPVQNPIKKIFLFWSK